MKFKFLSLLLLVTMGVRASDEDCKDKVSTAEKIVKVVQESSCPNKVKLKSLCMMVSNQMKDNTPNTKNQYLYQKKFQEAACVTENDSEQKKIEKIRETWNKLENDLVCNTVAFDVLDGNILKYAVSTKFDDFVDEAIAWKVNLNKVDSTDNRTVMDYIKFHIEKNKGNELEKMFQHYYYKLKKAGAKHQAEL
jgi:hypothetical protein